MYALFVRHHWPPSLYYRMGYGEKRITAEFLVRELKDEAEELKRLKKNVK